MDDVVGRPSVLAQLAIRGGTVVCETGRQQADVHIHQGRVLSIGASVPARDEIDATGLLVMPGMVETHAHFMDPGDTTREDFGTGTRAAALSGVTTVLEHTHASPVTTAEELVSKLGHVEGKSSVDFGLAAHALPGRSREAAALWAGGACYFKFFTCDTHGIEGNDTPNLRTWFNELASIGAPALVHCEDQEITSAAEFELKASGRSDPLVISEWRSLEAEQTAVHAVGEVARLSGASVCVAHCSSPSVVAYISHEKTEGTDLVAESCPQYFLLRASELATLGPLRKFTPPTRSRGEHDENVMWELLRSGEITLISSDHAPSTLAQKSEGSIWDCNFGLPGIDTTTSLLLDAASRSKISHEDVVRSYSSAPARQYGLWPRKGSLQVGADGDIILVDPSKRWTMTSERVHSKAGWTPYEGRNVTGQVVRTLLRGATLAKNGVISNLPPAGRFVGGAGLQTK